MAWKRFRKQKALLWRQGLPFVEVDVGLLANQVGVTASNTLYLGKGVHDLLLSINVGVEETQDELEVRLFGRNESCIQGIRISDCILVFASLTGVIVSKASVGDVEDVHMMGGLSS